MCKRRIYFMMLAMAIGFLLGCIKPNYLRKVIIEEKAGLDRKLEYVEIALASSHQEKVLFLKNTTTNTYIRGEKFEADEASKDSSVYIFPVSIKANELITYYLTASGVEENPSKLESNGEGEALKIENEYFVADFNTTERKIKNGLYPGQLAGVFLKNSNVLLQRSRINMHWCPNFQANEREYRTISHLPPNILPVKRNAYMIEMVKQGRLNDYPEIDLYGKYRFYAGLPYFVYSSTMTINKEVELTLLRNDEMTMDSLFTHLVYPDSSGNVARMPLYNITKFDSLTKAPLADDISWVGFINNTLGYGLVSIRLKYDNRNTGGEESPLYHPHTKISLAANNGRYWNRRLIHEHNTLVPKGSRYYEQNAYLVIDGANSDISTLITYYVERLNNPISISYVGM